MIGSVLLGVRGPEARAWRGLGATPHRAASDAGLTLLHQSAHAVDAVTPTALGW